MFGNRELNLRERMLRISSTYVLDIALKRDSNRVAEYEDRIKRLESLLQERGAAQPHIDQQPLQAATDTSIPVSTWVSNLRHEFESMPRPEAPDVNPYDLEAVAEVSGLLPPDDLSSLSINDISQNGSSLEVPLPLPIHESPSMIDDIQPSKAFQEDAAFLQNTTFEPELPPPLPIQDGCDWYLPPPELGTSLLAEFLTDFNSACPLYQPHVIADHLWVCYAGQSDGSAVSWISAYVVFGLAHMLRAMSATGTTYDNDMARYYLTRIYNGLNRLLVSPPSLGLVQCLIGTAVLITTTPCHFNMSEGHFISTALRVIQSLTYQDDKSDPTRDVEQEHRVFWLAFFYDTNASILTNSPTTHRREDVIACIPDGKLTGSLGAVTAAEGNWKVNMFGLRIKLAVLQAEATDQVLSLSTRNTTPTDLDCATAIVLARLQEFHEHEIFQLSPGQLFQLLYLSDIVHCVSLEATYFAVVFRLRAFEAFEQNPRINPFSLDGLKRIARVKQHKSHPEAKRLLSLLPIAPRGNVGLYWKTYRVFLAALVTVFAHHINNPTETPPTSTEISGYNQVLTDIGSMVTESGNVDIAQARDFCLSLFLKLQTGLRVQWIQGIAEGNDNITPATLHGVPVASWTA
ncbi:Nn.00g090250.m01.CDS01 [Neocucurbitaria sp. VM-36]